MNSTRIQIIVTGVLVASLGFTIGHYQRRATKAEAQIMKQRLSTLMGDEKEGDKRWYSHIYDPKEDPCRDATGLCMTNYPSQESLFVSHAGQRIGVIAPDWQCDAHKPGEAFTCRRGLYRQAYERERRIRALADRARPADHKELAAELRNAWALLRHHHLAVTED